MQKTVKRQGFFKKYGEWYLMLAIPVIGSIMFNIYPLIVNAFQSFKNTAGSWVGLVNYNILFTDVLWPKAIINTLYMGVIGVGLSIPIAFLLAYMLNRVPFAKNAFKTIYLFPMIVSIVAVSMVFKFIFNADANSPMNLFLQMIGLPKSDWFSGVSTSRETVMIMTLWKSVGHAVILFFAGLQTMPVELLEAADIDGANEWKKLWYITVPNMKNTLIFVFITNSIGALKRFADVYAIASEYGQPGDTLVTIMIYIYRKSFSTLFYKDLGVASAASIILFLFIIVITVIEMRVTGESESLISNSRKRGAR